MNADEVRELASRREGPSLDFKRDQYDWSKDGNLALAKDIMAIANGLQRGISVGHILIGVDEQPDGTGALVGVPYSAHLDDAAMHEKIKVLVNRVPSFTYAAVDVEGCSIGVIEVHGGGRPFFALRDSGRVHRLRRFEAPLRVGSSTDQASPDQIQAWAHEDDASSGDLRRIEIEEREARLVVLPSVDDASVLFIEDSVSCENALHIDFVVHNRGESRFAIRAVTQTWRLTQRFFDDRPEPIGRPSEPLRFERTEQSGPGLAPGTSLELSLQFDCEGLIEYISQQTGIMCWSSEWPLWIEGSVAVEVVGATGRRGTSTGTVTAASLEAAFIAGRAAANRARQERRRVAELTREDEASHPIPNIATIPMSEREAAAVAARLGPFPKRGPR